MALNLVPQSNQTLAVTQPLILANFTTIDSVFAVDHATFNTTNAGYHNKVTLINQSSAPAGVANANILYSFINPVTSVNDIYLNQNNDTPVPITASNYAQPGYAYLPSGIILQWGYFNSASSSNVTVTFPIAFPNAILSVTAGSTQIQQYVCSTNLTLTNFLARGSVTGSVFGTYIAIGY
jgi:hypothetical protein